MPSKESKMSQATSTVPLSFGEKMLAGSIARGVSQTVLHPVDVLRTRLQARNVTMTWKPSIFIKGMIPQMVLSLPAGAIQFVSFEAAKEKLITLMPDDKFTQARTLLAGAFGALMAASCRIPQELLKQRIQADIYPNLWVALQETVGKHGISSLYKGSVATISRDVPWNALSFMFHGQGKAMFKAAKGRDPANNENLLIAGVAGAIAAVIMTPIDVVKTRIMTSTTGSSSLMVTLRAIIAEEGAGTLMKGVLPRIVFLAPLAGITFSVYEAVAANIRQRKLDAASQTAGVVHDGISRNGFMVESTRKVTAFAMRFSKTPVRLARQSEHGSFLGDYASTSSRVLFSLPLAS